MGHRRRATRDPRRGATVSRAFRLAASGLLGTLALFAFLEPDPQDPLRTTAALLPLLVAGFAALRGESTAGRRSGPGLRSAVLSAVGAWGVCAVGWRHLTLQHAEPVIAAAGVLLLAGWLAVELPGLLRRLAGAGVGLPPRVFLLLPLLVYISVLPWVQAHHVPGGDEPYYLLVTHSLAYDGDIDLSNNYAADDALAFLSEPIEPQPGDPTGDEGRIYSRHSPAVPLLLALPYRLAGMAGAALVMLVLAAGVAWGGLALARELHPRRYRGQLLAWLILAFGSPLAAYTYRFWSEVPAALGLTLATLVILRLHGRGSLGTGRLLVLAVLLACPVLAKVRFALVAAPLAALAWWRTGRRWKPMVFVGATLLTAGAVVLLLHLALYGRLLGKYPLWMLDLRRFPVESWLNGATGLLLDGAFGLAAAYPLWLLVVPALALTLARRPVSRGLLLAWVPYFVMLLPRSNAVSQFAPPFRYALAVLPLLAACLVPMLEDRRESVRVITRALAGLTLVLAIVWIVQPEWTVHRVTGTTHLIDRLELLTHSDFGRLFPSYMRVRAAAWAWAGAVLLLAACWRWWPRGLRSRGFAAPLLLLIVACTAWTASHAPTRAVELEDRWLEHEGGVEWPPPWQPWSQPRGWRLASGERVRIPVVPGGPILRPSLRLGRPAKGGQRVALELRADDGRLLHYWTEELDPHPFWQWKTLPSTSLPSVRSPTGLTLRVVEPPQGKPSALHVRVRGLPNAPRRLRVALGSPGRVWARWVGRPERNRWIRVPVRRLRWRGEESHPLVQVPAGRSRTGSRGAHVALRLRFESGGTMRAELQSRGERIGAWFGALRRAGWRRLDVGEPSPPLVWSLPRRNYGTVVLDRATFEWMATPADDGGAAARGEVDPI